MSENGFLIITRPMFETTLPEYIQWKTSHGFSVTLKTAEEIDANYAGENIRYKIRNCIRDYYYNKNTKYVLLIGDSNEIPYPEGPEGPSPPTLGQPWSLPAGYYRVSNGTLYSTLFYSDLTDTVDYSSTSYSGQYKIYVGLIPVRTELELKAVLDKTMHYKLAESYIRLGASDRLDAQWEQNRYDQLVNLAKATAGDITINQPMIFNEASDQNTIYNALFKHPGIIDIVAHGNLGVIAIGSQAGLEVINSDGDKFQYINPLFIFTNICWADAYAYNLTYPANPLGECISEAWLKSAKGPATIISGVPSFKMSFPNVFIDSLEEGFWKDLFAQKSIGEAFYDNCSGSTPLIPEAKGAYREAINLFGDPSLKIVASKFLDKSWFARMLEIFLNVWQAIKKYLTG